MILDTLSTPSHKKHEIAVKIAIFFYSYDGGADIKKYLLSNLQTFPNARLIENENFFPSKKNPLRFFKHEGRIYEECKGQ